MNAVAANKQTGPNEDQNGGPNGAPGRGFSGGGPIFRIFSIVGVSAYLLSVLVYLLAKRRLTPPCSIKKILKAQFRGSYSAPITAAAPETGVCFIAPLPEQLISDAEGASRIAVYENGTPLPHARALHDDIRRLGSGRYSHWGSNLFFSTTDNSDPRTNGRTYTVAEV